MITSSDIAIGGIHSYASTLELDVVVVLMLSMLMIVEEQDE